MKKYWIVALIAGLYLSSYNLQAQDKGVKWLTLQEAEALNKKEPRKFYIDVYTDWCGWCKKMDQTTYMNPVIADILNHKYYPVKFNAESKGPVTFAGKNFVNTGNDQRSPHQLAIALLQGRMSYPSVAYVDQDHKLLSTIPGYLTAEQLEPLLSFFASESYKTMSWQKFQETFKGQLSQK